MNAQRPDQWRVILHHGTEVAYPDQWMGRPVQFLTLLALAYRVGADLPYLALSSEPPLEVHASRLVATLARNSYITHPNLYWLERRRYVLESARRMPDFPFTEAQVDGLLYQTLHSQEHLVIESSFVKRPF